MMSADTVKNQLTVAERTHRAFTGKSLPDRVPVHSWLGLQFIRTLVPRQHKMHELFQWWIDDPIGTLVKYQEDLGFDPMMTTYSQHIGEHEIWARMIFQYQDAAYAEWDETITEQDRKDAREHYRESGGRAAGAQRPAEISRHLSRGCCQSDTRICYAAAHN